MRLTEKCEKCGKVLELAQSFKLSDTLVMETFKCGHTFTRSTSELASATDANTQVALTSVDGTKHAYPYQNEGIHFILGQETPEHPEYAEYGRLRGNNCIIGDQMRLGKTPQSLLATRTLLERKQVSKVLIVVRSANLWQWIREYKTFADSLPLGIYPIQGTKSFIPPGFNAYVISMDTFSRSGTCLDCKHALSRHLDDKFSCKAKDCECKRAVDAQDSIADKLLAFGFDLIIVDEAHSFKNTDTNRTKTLVAFLQEVSTRELVIPFDFRCMNCSHTWVEDVNKKIDTTRTTISKSTNCPKCGAYNAQTAQIEQLKTRKCQIILLTGTAVINRADEYFVPLNLVAPTIFPSIARFRADWCEQDAQGKWSRIKSYRRDSFLKMIAPYVLRREKEDIYKDLPPINRMFTVIEIQDENLKKAYNKVLDSMEEKMDRGNYTYFDSIGELTMLRRICGLAKLDFVANYAETLLMDADKPKIAIGYHHHDVRDLLKMKLAHLGVCKLDGQDSADEKDRIAHKYFEHSPETCLLLGMSAMREGVELVYIPYALVLERMWSSAHEEQFEFRFYNPSKDYLKTRGLENKVTNVEYIVAKGTIDEWFYDMIEQKRKMFGETISNNWDVTQDADSFRDLVKKTVSHRL